MNINIGEYYEHKLEMIVARGVAATKTEALRMSVAAFVRQLEGEESELSAQTLADVEKARQQVRKGQGLSTRELLKSLGD